MILCDISDSERYCNISPAVAQAIGWLRGHCNDEIVDGSYEVGGLGVIVNAQSTALLPREKVQLEAHKKYIDIHVPLKGVEIIGWASLAGLNYVHQPYDEDTDLAFYGDMATCLLHVHPGQIAIFFPEDAHAPNIGIGNHRKLCIKIPV